MNIQDLPEVDHETLPELLINLGTEVTLGIWGSPGIGKSESIYSFGRFMNMPVSIFLGSQMNPEDIAVPLIDPESRLVEMCPQRRLVGDEARIIFLDELNGAEPDVSRGFFSIVNERMVGDHKLPANSVVVAAMNPMEDNSVTREIPAPLMSRLYHVRFRLKNIDSWMQWAGEKGIHPLVTSFIQEAGLSALAPERPVKDNEVSTNPRSWAACSAALKAFNAMSLIESGDRQAGAKIERIARGALHSTEAAQFGAFITRRGQGINLTSILRGEMAFPDPLQERAVAMGLITLLRSRLSKELPVIEADLRQEGRTLMMQSMRLLQELSQRAPELQQAIISDPKIPSYFLRQLGKQLQAVMN